MSLLKLGETRKVELVIIGGGLSGCWAALKARQKGLKVCLIDKAKVGQSGCSRFASGDFKSMLPHTNFNQCLEKIVVSGGFLGHQEWIEKTLKESYSVVEEMESMGLHFLKASDGNLMVKNGILPELTISSDYLMPEFRKILIHLGVDILDRCFVYKLLKDGSGKIKGLIAFSTREFTYHIFLCKAVVLAAGSCSLKAAYFGHQFSTGDAYALALDAGASLINMEAVNHNVSFKNFDSTANSFFRKSGALYINGRGNEFLSDYKSVPLGHAMALEVKKGNGPLYIDFSRISENYLIDAKKIMPWLNPMLDFRKLDKKKVEIIAAFAGSRATSAGIYIDINGNTQILGLFATGDAAAMLGNGMGAIGINLLNCSVFGRRCGIAAAEYCKNIKMSNEEIIIPELKFNNQEKEYFNSDDILLEIQKAIIPSEIIILRSSKRLKNALGRIKEIKNDLLKKVIFKDPHEFIKKIETKNMLIYAEAMLLSALTREESRVLHFREDFPFRDDIRWLKWIKLFRKDRNLNVELINLPKNAFKYLKVPKINNRDETWKK